MKIIESIDFLNYRSWWYQINWYGMKFESARKLYKDWKKFEYIYKNENKN